MRRVVITGANRGLGLEFVRQLRARGDHVVAACRDPAAAGELAALAASHPGRLHVVALDVADPVAIARAGESVARHLDGIDLLVNNAGRLVSGERFGSVSADALSGTLQVNAIGPFLLTQALAPLLAASDAPVVANISSQLGSITRTDGFHTPSYAISKAALNMATVLLAHALAAQRARVVAFHPGWVRTDMGGAGAPLAAPDAVAGLLRVIDGLKPADNGRFLDHLGAALPW